MNYRSLFGPVPSRRLGISLGVDLVPPKVCTLDCVYCEAGRTTLLTTERAEYVPTHEVLAELEHFLATGTPLDHITFSGSGEPTLHSGIGTVLHYLKRNTDTPVALLTNSTLLCDPAVRNEVREADLLLPSLDAASQEATLAINRPHPSIRAEQVVEGLARMREESQGQMWLEIFLLDPLNTGEEELAHLQAALDRIRPDRVQLNSLDRPAPESWVRKVTPEVLERVAAALHHPRVEVICKYRSRGEIRSWTRDVEESILATITRRPCTAADLAESLGLAPEHLNPYLDLLETEQKVKAVIQDRGIFYQRRCH